MQKLQEYLLMIKIYMTKKIVNYHMKLFQIKLKLGIILLMKMMVDYVYAKDLREAMGWKDSTKFKKKYLNPLIENGLVELSNPDTPTSPSQRYRLTEKGRALLEITSN